MLRRRILMSDWLKVYKNWSLVTELAASSPRDTTWGTI